jgi:hypothetical protein
MRGCRPGTANTRAAIAPVISALPGPRSRLPRRECLSMITEDSRTHMTGIFRDHGIGLLEIFNCGVTDLVTAGLLCGMPDA